MRRSVNYVRNKHKELGEPRDLSVLFDDVKHDQLIDYDRYVNDIKSCKPATLNPERVDDGTSFFETDAHKSWERDNRHRLTLKLYAAKCVWDSEGKKTIIVSPVKKKTKKTDNIAVLDNVRTKSATYHPPGTRAVEVREYLRNERHEIVHRDEAMISEGLKYLDNMHGRIHAFNSDYSLVIIESYWKRSDIDERKTISNQVDKLFAGIVGIIEKLFRLSSKGKTVSLLENLIAKIRADNEGLASGKF